ncbi:heat shock 70 kDa protein 12B-like isoform X3 [Mercenaria mercenaria]|uniref:heat shock 70 kDa protein 12B-like isoform X3 n=1 Tax=Mercenaria mercenaria TaxID=6596 RepID=UPI00234F0B9C|nr:heat shock 70 kDa protein 12B-like isoform X3 [Mercenaria mercenaria]
MVVDIGGGTAGITVHEKQSDGNLRELCWASGGDWGGTKVDEEFLRMLEGLMGKAAVERFKRECMADLFDLLRQFETVKRTTDPKLDGKLKIRLPESLRDISRNANRSAFMNTLLKSIQALQNEGLSVEKDKLRIDANKAREMFAYSVDGMCMKMRKILSNPKAAGVRHILVVGGFSDSPVVREALKKNFRDVSLIFPPEPSLAVLKGAVLYGHKPQIIASRIAKFTYGLKHEEDFDESKHKKKYRRSINGKPMCEKLFQILVKKGDTVLNKQKVAIQNQPMPDDHNVLTYKLYLCTKRNPMYVDEPECKKHGAVRTQLIPGDMEVEAVLIVKDTDMIIELKHVKSRKSQTERFDFM